MKVESWMSVVAFGERGEGHDPVAVTTSTRAAKSAARWWLAATDRETFTALRDITWEHNTQADTWIHTLPNRVDQIVIFKVPRLSVG